jgi:hypothetical protein
MRAPRIEPRPEFTTQFDVGLDHQMHVRPFWRTMLYIEGAYQASVSMGCCAQVDAELVLVGRVPPCRFIGHV